MRQISNSNHSYSHPSYDAKEDCLRGSNRRSYGNAPWSNNGELSLSAFNGLIGLILLYGLVVNVILIKCCAQYFVNINHIVLLIGYFVLAISGIAISRRSHNPAVSFIGYNMVVLPCGVVLSIVLDGISNTLVLNACAVTAGVTAIMIIASIIKPDFFLSLGRALGIALMAMIIIEFILLLCNVIIPTFWDALVALIFCGYIGYDWAMAQKNPHTVDGAVDACVDLYLDIANLFLRILSIMDNNDD